MHGKNVFDLKSGEVLPDYMGPDGGRWRTRSIPKNLNPKWDETFMIKIQCNPELVDGAGTEETKEGMDALALVLQVFDKDTGMGMNSLASNDFLGEVRLPYSDLIDNNPGERKLKLTNTDGHTGKIKKSKKRFDWGGCTSIPAIDVDGDLGELSLRMSLLSAVEVNVLEAFGLKAVNPGGKDSDPQLTLQLVGLPEGLSGGKKKKGRGDGVQKFASRTMYKVSV